MPYAIYIASVVGAIALLLMMPRAGYNPRKLGALLGAATLGGLWIWLSRDLLALESPGLPRGALPYYYIFSALAIGSAVRVITHDRPVYSALWFIMVVLASAGLFLILSAEFMAFAMIIIYAGAILVTYVFVIMLASQAGDPVQATAQGMVPAGDAKAMTTDAAPEYDRVAREPVVAIAAGFLLLAVLLSAIFGRPMQPNPAARADSDQQIMDTVLTERPARNLGEQSGAAAMQGQHLQNAERIGLDLFRHHPLGLELAGVILLVSLVGAVVIARKQVDEGTP